MNICFVTAGPIEWASSRMRAYWVAEALRERGHDVGNLEMKYLTEVYDNPGDICIWQKTANLPLIKASPHVRHYWDVCDPSWWWQPNECKEIARHMTAVVASTEALATDFNQWYGEDLATCIPDRLKLSHFHTQRQHNDVSPVRFIWFGIAANRVALWAAKANMERLVANGYKIELTIFDNRPDLYFQFSDVFPIYHLKWSLEKEVEVLASHDIALLPPYPGPWGEVKSNNKALTAWACGLPMVDGLDYRMCDLFAGEMLTRLDGASYGERQIDKLGTVAQSAIEWERLLT